MKAAKRPRINRSTRSEEILLDPVEELLPELMEKIFSYLPLKDLVACSAVLRHWREATSNDSLWRGLCKRRSWHDCGKLDSCINCFERLKNDVNRISDFSDWRRHFILKTQLKRNWYTGKYQKGEIMLTTEENASITCVNSSNIALAYGCNNGQVRVYDSRDEYKLIQTIQCRDDSPIDSIRMSEKYLVFTQSLLLYVFKRCRKGNYKFCSIKSMCTENVVEIRSPLKYIGENLVKNSKSTQHNSSNEIPFGIKFLMVNDSLIAATSTSPVHIHVWNLNLRFARKCQVLELADKTEVGDICVANNTLYLSLIVKNEKNEISRNPFCWYIQAFSMRNFRQLYCSEKHSHSEVSLPALQASNSYVLVSFRPRHSFLFDRYDGSLLYQGSNLVFLNAEPKNSDLIFVKVKDSLKTYNPKTKKTTGSIGDIKGLIWGVYYNLMILLPYPIMYGSDMPYITFSVLEQSLHKSVVSFLAFRSISNPVYIDETKLGFYVNKDGDRYLYIVSFIA